jgi:hypothetical protein
LSLLFSESVQHPIYSYFFSLPNQHQQQPQDNSIKPQREDMRIRLKTNCPGTLLKYLKYYYRNEKEQSTDTYKNLELCWVGGKSPSQSYILYDYIYRTFLNRLVVARSKTWVKGRQAGGGCAYERVTLRIMVLDTQTYPSDKIPEN